MDHLAISEQVLIEHQTLAFVTSALRSTIGWKYQGTDLTRKLESLRFVGQSFERHLKRLMALEEDDGYMTVVLTSRPELKESVDTLRQEHVHFRKALSRILSKLRRVDRGDHEKFATTSNELLALLDQLDEHGKKETSLLQEALLTDEGGEG
jgi:hypothetical protein